MLGYLGVVGFKFTMFFFLMGMLRGKDNMMIKHRILMASHTIPTKETQTWAPPEMQ
jgi:hypothetical protein